MSRVELVIAGARGGTNVGDSLYEGARELGLSVELLDTREASKAPWPVVKVNWHLMGHRPARLGWFSRRAVEECERLRPRWFLSVGIAPVNAAAVRSMRAAGVRTLNFLTDDLWNRAHRAPWAMRATREYDCVVSPRRANMGDLSALGCADVRYVPFGYDTRHSYPEPTGAAVDPSLASELIFVGGADADRAPLIGALLQQGIDVALYGSYWDRFAETRGRSRGQASPDVIRRATAAAKVALCLVRRANRDGHVMRSLEIPAVGTAMLVEDTEEHRELFGPDGENVSYFRDGAEMVERARWLLEHDAERERLARSAHARITGGAHTYADRLAAMLELPAR